jgi:hypothetical protein
VFPDLGYDASQTGRAPRVGNSNISIDVFRRCSFEAYIDAELAEAMVVQLRVVITPMLRSPEARGKVTGTPSPVIWGLDPRRDRVVSCEKQDQGGVLASSNGYRTARVAGLWGVGLVNNPAAGGDLSAKNPRNL